VPATVVVGAGANPTLAMIVNRYLEIQNFKPEPFWTENSFREQFFPA
jgi:DNA topoisomerase-3